jgi:hypothetical protein
MGVVLAVLGAQAQAPAKFGLKGGINLSTFNHSSAEYDSRIGLHLGGLAHIHLAPEWAIQPELIYSQEGGEDFNNTKIKLDYINIPVMLQYMFSNGFRIEAGPQIGILVNEKYKYTNGTEEEFDDFKTVNTSIGFGLNYLSNGGIGVGGRYNLGLNDISESRSSTAKNNTFQISLFYMFDSDHKAKSR